MTVRDDPRLPEIDLRQVVQLTDDTGIVQHATFGVPDHHHGYCIDDNCRALIAGLLQQELGAGVGPELPLHRYLAFIAYAFNSGRGRFRNFMGFDRRWLEESGSDDSHARTLWSLGMACHRAVADDVRDLAERLFLDGLIAVRDFPYLRSRAFAIIGLVEYLAAHPGHGEARDLLAASCALLHRVYRRESTPDWRWWEDVVTYANGKLPQALIQGGMVLGDPAMVDDGVTALRWLIEQQTAPAGHLSIIGNDGWLRRDGARARFDQQPLEAHALVDACIAAAVVTDDGSWFERARWAGDWFFGANDLGRSLYVPDSGGCHDGLQADGVNRNQGAESTLAMVISVLLLHGHQTMLSAAAAGVQDGVQITGPLPAGIICTARRCLLAPADLPPSQTDLTVAGVFNPGAVDFGQETLVLARIAEMPRESSTGLVSLPRWEHGQVCMDRVRSAALRRPDPRLVEHDGLLRLTSTSHLRLFRCPRDAALVLDGHAGESWLPQDDLEAFGLEDPRLVQVEGRLLATYVAVSPHGVATALAASEDGRRWERLGVILPPENKDVVLFPERVGGRYALLHRPNPRGWFGPPAMWIAFADDLTHWGDYRPLSAAHIPGTIDDGRRRWAIGRVGGGCPPVRIDRGWLVIYHGSAKVSDADPDAPGVYVALVMVLDAEDPSRVIARCRSPLFVPAETFERHGFLQGVVFPTAILDRGDRWCILYGAADRSIGMLDIDKVELEAHLVPV